MGGFFCWKVATTKQAALGAVQEELDEFQKEWDAYWWDLRMSPCTECITLDNENWENWLNTYYQDHPWTSSVPEELFIGTAWLHS